MKAELATSSCGSSEGGESGMGCSESTSHDGGTGFMLSGRAARSAGRPPPRAWAGCSGPARTGHGQRVAEVEADTTSLVAGIERQAENIGTRTESEVEKLKAEYDAQIAALDSRRRQVTGGAEAEVTKLTETAKSGLYQLKMDLFQHDGDAFLRYSLSEQLNPKMVLRLFHSGAGTFWTNLEGKGISLMLPAAGVAPASVPASKK